MAALLGGHWSRPTPFSRLALKKFSRLARLSEIAIFAMQDDDISRKSKTKPWKRDSRILGFKSGESDLGYGHES